MTSSPDEGRRLQRGIADGELDEVAAALVDAFADYPLTMSFTADSLRGMAAADDIVLDSCRLLREGDGGLVGVGLAALRGSRGRVAAMGVTRASARTGVGRAVGEALLEAFAEVGAREVILEALTVNAPALALYESLGFERRRRLLGFVRAPGGEPISPGAWDEALAGDAEPASWQLDRVIAAAREQADLVSVSPVVPERHPVAALLRDSGFGPGPIDQFEMARLL